MQKMSSLASILTKLLVSFLVHQAKNRPLPDVGFERVKVSKFWEKLRVSRGRGAKKFQLRHICLGDPWSNYSVWSYF